MAQKGKKMNHIIVCRVNMPRELDPSNHVRPAPYKDPAWNERRIELLNEITRPSLRKQTHQDFTFVTFWGKHHRVDREGKLNNEVQLTIRRGFDEEDEKAFDFKTWRAGEKLEKDTMDFALQVRHRLRVYFANIPSPFLFTNIDSDDALHHKFVERIQKAVPKYVDRAPFYLDVVERYLMHLETKGTGVKRRRRASPMVSTIENEIECYPLKYHHSHLDDHIKGTKIKGLYAMQTVGDTNILTEGIGKKVPFDVNDFI